MISSPLFSPGDMVRVKDDWPESRGPAHIRTPHYLRGHQGQIVRRLGEHPNPCQVLIGRLANNLSVYYHPS